MSYLKIKNKKDFVSNFLGPVSNLNDVCILSIEGNSMSCTLASADATIVCKSTIEVDTDLDNVKLNFGTALIVTVSKYEQPFAVVTPTK